MATPPGRPHQEPPGRPSGGPGGVLEESGGDPVRVSRNILGGIPGIREKHMGVPGAPRGCPGASQSRPGASAGQLRLGVGKVPGQDKTIDRDLIPRCAHADAQFCDSPRCAHAPRRGTRAPKLTTHTQATQPQAPPPHHATDSKCLLCDLPGVFEETSTALAAKDGSNLAQTCLAQATRPRRHAPHHILGRWMQVLHNGPPAKRPPLSFGGDPAPRTRKVVLVARERFADPAS